MFTSNVQYSLLPSWTSNPHSSKFSLHKLVRLFKPTSFPRKCLLLTIGWNIFYGLGLEGKHTPEEMNVTLGKLGIYLLLTEIFFSTLVWQIVLHLRQGRRRLGVVLVALNLYAWYLYDHGNFLEEHGAFNMLCFVMIYVPLNLIACIIYYWLHKAGSARRFAIQFAFMWAIFMFWAVLRLYHAYHLLDVGFWGRKVSSCDPSDLLSCPHKRCTWDKPISWIDLLPIRQNFFFGAMTCPKIESFFAEIDSTTGILRVNGCPSSTTTHLDSYFNSSTLQTFKGPAVSFLPDTESWGYTLKADSLEARYNSFQENVLRYVESHTYPYKDPGFDLGSVQTVLVRCGTSEPKLVYRVRPAVKETNKSPGGELNVLVVFMDAVSRRHFFRKLPKTVQTLEKFTVSSGTEHVPDEQPVLHQFMRYHSVGLNTGPNTRALWANIPPSDTQTGGFPIWEDFTEDGYATGRMDGVCEDWNAFYNTAHFPNKTSLKINPLVTHEWLAFSCLPPYLPVGKGFAGNFAGSTSIKPHCLSGSHLSWHMMDWLDAFMDTYYKQQRKFFVSGVFLEGHEGSTEVIATLDERYSKFLDPATSRIDYNKTAVFLMADHGLHMGLNYIFFDNAHVEEVQPFSAVILPAWYLRKHGSKMTENEDRLVTGHDFWATMQGLRGVDRAKHSGIGKNLITENVGDRMCMEVGIEDEWCRCKVQGPYVL